eukprot:Tbor_TRINITY_DN3243_c0_g1::TRINITY_DN3243_c0_g1_i2::g.23754::m.23754
MSIIAYENLLSSIEWKDTTRQSPTKRSSPHTLSKHSPHPPERYDAQLLSTATSSSHTSPRGQRRRARRPAELIIGDKETHRINSSVNHVTIHKTFMRNSVPLRKLDTPRDNGMSSFIRRVSKSRSTTVNSDEYDGRDILFSFARTSERKQPKYSRELPEYLYKPKPVFEKAKEDELEVEKKYSFIKMKIDADKRQREAGMPLGSVPFLVGIRNPQWDMYLPPLSNMMDSKNKHKLCPEEESKMIARLTKSLKRPLPQYAPSPEPLSEDDEIALVERLYVVKMPKEEKEDKYRWKVINRENRDPDEEDPDIDEQIERLYQVKRFQPKSNEEIEDVEEGRDPLSASEMQKLGERLSDPEFYKKRTEKAYNKYFS